MASCLYNKLLEFVELHYHHHILIFVAGRKPIQGQWIQSDHVRSVLPPIIHHHFDSSAVISTHPTSFRLIRTPHFPVPVYYIIIPSITSKTFEKKSPTLPHTK
jgi:hypothetical protein